MFELHHLTALEQLDWLRRGEVTPRELAEHYLERIDRLDGDLGAFVTVTPERALERADAVAGTPHSRGAVGPADRREGSRGARPACRPGSARALFADFVPDESDEIVTALARRRARSASARRTRPSSGCRATPSRSRTRRPAPRTT